MCAVYYANSVTKGYELQMGTNCLGPYLLTKLLLPVLQRTAASSPEGAVRVTWASSLATEVSSPKGGITFNAQGAPEILSKGANYAQTKVGNVFLSHEMAKRYGKDGIISVVSRVLLEILASYQILTLASHGIRDSLQLSWADISIVCRSS